MRCPRSSPARTLLVSLVPWVAISLLTVGACERGGVTSSSNGAAGAAGEGGSPAGASGGAHASGGSAEAGATGHDTGGGSPGSAGAGGASSGGANTGGTSTGGAGAGGSGAGGTSTGGTSTGGTANTLGCESDPGCESPIGGCFVRVPGSTELGTADFCISKFEVKNHEGSPWSLPKTLPWVTTNSKLPATECAELGAEFSQPSNAQWQTLARNIEGVAANWSGGQVGTGDLARGHSDGAPPQALPVTNIEDPCNLIDNPSCATVGSDFAQHRTHLLSTGSEIWDVSGNVDEWVISPGVLDYYEGYVAGLPEDLRTVLGPAGTYPVTSSAELANVYPAYVLVEAGALATVSSRNFGDGNIWVRSGGTLLLRGGEFWGRVYLEPGALFINENANMRRSGNRYSASSIVTGSLGEDPVVSETTYGGCSSSCPEGTEKMTKDASRGLGWAMSYTGNLARGGHFGSGPTAGVFAAFSQHEGSSGFRCVKAPQP